MYNNCTRIYSKGVQKTRADTSACLRCPRRMTRLLVILVVAYAWMISLGCHAVERNQASRLIRDGAGRWRHQWSLFREDWCFFGDAVIRKGIFLRTLLCRRQTISLKYVPTSVILGEGL